MKKETALEKRQAGKQGKKKKSRNKKEERKTPKLKETKKGRQKVRMKTFYCYVWKRL
jgi:hypothetical protein